MRVVSLVPSVTETLLALGVAPVACTRFCEQPDLAHVGGTKTPDLEAIAGLAPDLVILDTEENRREDAEALEAAGLAVHVTSVRSVADVVPTVTALAAAVGAPEPAWSGGGDLVTGAVRATAAIPVFVPVWRRPWMTVNGRTYGSDLLRAVGLSNVFADHGDAYPTVTAEEVTARHPVAVLAPSEPYPFGARHLPELKRMGAVTFVDGKDLFWWGARTPAAATRLRSLAATLT